MVNFKWVYWLGRRGYAPLCLGFAHLSHPNFARSCLQIHHNHHGMLLRRGRTQSLVLSFGQARFHSKFVKPTVTVCRLMGPAESNIAGSIHGGHILQMIEDAGTVITTRYCNHAQNKDPTIEPCISGLARVERTDFIQGMRVGDLAELEAAITYTSPHSLEVLVSVWAEHMVHGQTKRLTNQARLWYVPMSQSDVSKVVPVPPMSYADHAAEAVGKQHYEHQKQERHHQATYGINTDLLPSELFHNPPLHTMAASRSILSHLVGPMDCIPCSRHSQWVRGGVVMKLMDECAAIASGRHCLRASVVTVSMDATNFHKKVSIGSLLKITGTVVFCSSKSIEVEVLVDVETPFTTRPWQNPKEKFPPASELGLPGNYRAVEALFTFVSLDDNRQVLPVPQLQLNTKEERTLFEAGLQRYEVKKKMRK